MALDSFVGNFALNTSEGNQAVTGVGFRPKIVLFMPTPMTADGIQVDLRMAFGAGISSTERMVFEASSEDGQGTTDTASESSAALCLMLNNVGTTTADVEADLVTLDADGFTINITTAPGTAYRVGYMALGGADLTNVAIGDFAASNGSGNQSVTGVGFQPDGIIFVLNRRGSMGAAGGDAHLSLGFATSSSERGCIGMFSNSGAATSQTTRHQRTDACIISLGGSTGNENGLADFVSFDADGFTVNWSNAHDPQVGYIAFKGGQYFVGNLTTQTGTGTFAETGVGFQGNAGIFASFCNAADAASAGVDHLERSVGFATLSTERFSIGGTDEDGQATSDVDGYNNDGLIYENYDFAQTLEGSIDFSSWDADGFTLDQIDADPSANQMIYMIFGDAAGAAATIPIIQHHRRMQGVFQ
jgi:hypothetical protein